MAQLIIKIKDDTNETEKKKIETREPLLDKDYISKDYISKDKPESKYVTSTDKRGPKRWWRWE